MSSFIDIEANRKRLQNALNEKLQLNPPLAIDGVLGPRSLFAMKQFQQRVSLLPTDNFDPRILPFLGLAPQQETTPMAVGIPDIAGWLNTSVILGVLRNVLISAGTVLTTSGFFTGAQWEQIVGVIVMIVSAILSGLSNKKAEDAKQIAKAVDAHPELTVIPKTDGTAAIAVR